jgi:hypothetical protein
MPNHYVMSEFTFKILLALYTISSTLQCSNIQERKYVVIEASDQVHAPADLLRQISSHYPLERNLVTPGSNLMRKFWQRNLQHLFLESNSGFPTRSSLPDTVSNFTTNRFEC